METSEIRREAEVRYGVPEVREEVQRIAFLNSSYPFFTIFLYEKIHEASRVPNRPRNCLKVISLKENLELRRWEVIHDCAYIIFSIIWKNEHNICSFYKSYTATTIRLFLVFWRENYQGYDLFGPWRRLFVIL